MDERSENKTGKERYNGRQIRRQGKQGVTQQTGINNLGRVRKIRRGNRVANTSAVSRTEQRSADIWEGIGKHTSDAGRYVWLAVDGGACTGMPSDPRQTCSGTRDRSPLLSHLL
jgi:hypothetical protein